MKHNCKRCGNFEGCDEYGLCKSCRIEFDIIIDEALAGFIANWDEEMFFETQNKGEGGEG